MSSNPALRDREARGLVRSNRRFIVRPEQIAALKARAKHDFQQGKPDVLYSAIDPSGGGDKSEYVIVTVALVCMVPVVSMRAHALHPAVLEAIEAREVVGPGADVRLLGLLGEHGAVLDVASDQRPPEPLSKRVRQEERVAAFQPDTRRRGAEQVHEDRHDLEVLVHRRRRVQRHDHAAKLGTQAEHLLPLCVALQLLQVDGQRVDPGRQEVLRGIVQQWIQRRRNEEVEAHLSLSLVCQIVGLDRTDSHRAKDIEEMIDRHYRSLRSHYRYGRCHVRVFIEANLSFIDADRVATQLEQPCYGNLEVVRFDPGKKNRYGIWTTKDSKNVYCSEIQRATGTLTLANEFICAPRMQEDHVAELWKQMGEFHEEVTASASGTSYTVHQTGKGPGSRDDIFMALGIALAYAYRSLQELPFTQMLEARGLAAA